MEVLKILQRQCSSDGYYIKHTHWSNLLKQHDRKFLIGLPIWTRTLYDQIPCWIEQSKLHTLTFRQWWMQHIRFNSLKLFCFVHVDLNVFYLWLVLHYSKHPQNILKMLLGLIFEYWLPNHIFESALFNCGDILLFRIRVICRKEQRKGCS